MPALPQGNHAVLIQDTQNNCSEANRWESTWEDLSTAEPAVHYLPPGAAHLVWVGTEEMSWELREGMKLQSQRGVRLPQHHLTAKLSLFNCKVKFCNGTYDTGMYAAKHFFCVWESDLISLATLPQRQSFLGSFSQLCATFQTSAEHWCSATRERHHKWGGDKRPSNTNQHPSPTWETDPWQYNWLRGAELCDSSTYSLPTDTAGSRMAEKVGFSHHMQSRIQE